jgi:hypothetical protein
MYLPLGFNGFIYIYIYIYIYTHAHAHTHIHVGSTSKNTYSITIVKINSLMLIREIIAVLSKNRTKQINTLCTQLPLLKEKYLYKITFLSVSPHHLISELITTFL